MQRMQAEICEKEIAQHREEVAKHVSTEWCRWLDYDTAPEQREKFCGVIRAGVIRTLENHVPYAKEMISMVFFPKGILAEAMQSAGVKYLLTNRRHVVYTDDYAGAFDEYEELDGVEKILYASPEHCIREIDRLERVIKNYKTMKDLEENRRKKMLALYGSKLDYMREKLEEMKN